MTAMMRKLRDRLRRKRGEQKRIEGGERRRREDRLSRDRERRRMQLESSMHIRRWSRQGNSNRDHITWEEGLRLRSL